MKPRVNLPDLGLKLFFKNQSKAIAPQGSFPCTIEDIKT